MICASVCRPLPIASSQIQKSYSGLCGSRGAGHRGFSIVRSGAHMCPNDGHSSAITGCPWNYEEFSMNIDVIIPASTKHKNYLKHPSCDASTVAELHGQGLTVPQISEAFGVTEHIVRPVLRALNLRPNRRKRPEPQASSGPSIPSEDRNQHREEPT